VDSLSIDRDPPTTIRSLLEHADLFERLNDVPLNTGGRVLVVGRAVTTTVLLTVELGQCADADVFSEVDVTSDGGWRADAAAAAAAAV
jgi:hypothetical protein